MGSQNYWAIGSVISMAIIIILGHKLSPVTIDFDAERGDILTPAEGLKKYLKLEDTLK